MGESYLLARGTHLVHGSMEMSIGTTETNNEQLGILGVSLYHKVGYGDGIYLLLAQTGHQVVVLGVGRDGTCLVVLLQTTEDMLESFASGHCPVAHAILLLTLVGSPCTLQFFRHVGRIDGCIFSQIGQAESARAVSHEGIGEQHHGSHVLQGNLTGHVGCIEAVCGRCSCQYRHGRLAVTAKEHLQQVGLLRLGGQSRGRSSALYVEYYERKFHDDGEVHRLGLEADAGSRGGCHSQSTCKRSANSRSASGNLVFALYGGHAQRLVFGEFVQHIGSRSDGV